MAQGRGQKSFGNRIWAVYVFIAVIAAGCFKSDQQTKVRVHPANRPVFENITESIKGPEFSELTDDVLDPNKHFIKVIEPCEPDALYKTLVQWATTPVNPSDDLVELDELTCNDLVSGKVFFDATPFAINGQLVNALKNSKKLEWLRLDVHAKNTDFDWIGDLTNLTGLSIVNTNLIGADLSPLENLAHLKWLRLYGSNLTESNFGEIRLPQLIYLDLGGKYTLNDHLPNIGSIPKLQVLFLGRSQITDAGLEKVISACPELRNLYLGWCMNLTGNVAESLTKLKMLRYVYLGHTELAIVEVRHRLQESLPDCYIGFAD